MDGYKKLLKQGSPLDNQLKARAIDIHIIQSAIFEEDDDGNVALLCRVFSSPLGVGYPEGNWADHKRVKLTGKDGSH